LNHFEGVFTGARFRRRFEPETGAASSTVTVFMRKKLNAPTVFGKNSQGTGDGLAPAFRLNFRLDSIRETEYLPSRQNMIIG
jgi:hypothetical protein